MAGYLGNNANRIVHHLATMTSGCNIYNIKIQDRIYFTPDTLEEAKKQKFAPCNHCIESVTN